MPRQQDSAGLRALGVPQADFNNSIGFNQFKNPKLSVGQANINNNFMVDEHQQQQVMHHSGGSV